MATAVFYKSGLTHYQIINPYNMNAPDSDGIIQKDLDCHEQTVVADLEEWLKANPQAQWNEVAGLKLVEQCPETNLRQIQKRLAQVRSSFFFPSGESSSDDRRISALLHLGHVTRVGSLGLGLESSFRFLLVKAVTSKLESTPIPL